MKTDLPQKISFLLKQKNLNISELEKNSGLSNSVVSNIINGRTKSPSAEVLCKIATNLGCSVNYLLSELTVNPIDIGAIKINYFLCAEAAIRLSDYLIKAEFSLSVHDFFSCAFDIYTFATESGQIYIDDHFVKWSAKKYLPPG